MELFKSSSEDSNEEKKEAEGMFQAYLRQTKLANFSTPALRPRIQECAPFLCIYPPFLCRELPAYASA